MVYTWRGWTRKCLWSRGLFPPSSIWAIDTYFEKQHISSCVNILQQWLAQSFFFQTKIYLIYFIWPRFSMSTYVSHWIAPPHTPPPVRRPLQPWTSMYHTHALNSISTLFSSSCTPQTMDVHGRKCVLVWRHLECHTHPHTLWKISGEETCKIIIIISAIQQEDFQPTNYHINFTNTALVFLHHFTNVR